MLENPHSVRVGLNQDVLHNPVVAILASEKLREAEGWIDL